MKPKDLKGKRTLVAKLLIPIVVFAVAIACLSLFWLGRGEASGPLDLQAFESKALTEAQKLVPEAVSMEGVAGAEESDMFSNMYSLNDKAGNSIGAISADPMTGEVVCFYDAREQGPSANVLISLDQATGIAERFLLEEKGIDVKEGPVRITSAELKGKGMEGPADNLTEIFQYMFEFKETANGVPIDDSTGGTIVISPEDGRIVSYSINRRISTSSGKEVGEIKLSEDEAIAIAIKAIQEKLQLFTEPYISEIRFVAYGDFGNGRMTPYVTLVLYFGDQDMVDTLYTKYMIDVFISLETGEILHMD